MKRKQMILVVGLGRFGTALCEQLSALSQNIVAVDADKERVAAVSDYVDIAARADATDEDALVKVGAKEADVGVVAIGESLEASVLATTILKGLGIPLVIARAQSAIHARILSRVGAQKVIFPERDIGKRVAEQIVHPWISSFSHWVKLPDRLFRAASALAMAAGSMAPRRPPPTFRRRAVWAGNI